MKLILPILLVVFTTNIAAGQQKDLAVEEDQLIRWSRHPNLKVEQISGEQNAILSVAYDQHSMSGYSIGLNGERMLGRVSDGPAIRFWYEGATDGWADGQRLESLPFLMKTGSKTYQTAIGGTNTVPLVRVATESDLERLFPGITEIRLKDGSEVQGVFLKKSGSRVLIHMPLQDNMSEVVISKLDKRSRSTFNAWKKEHQEPTESELKLIERWESRN